VVLHVYRAAGETSGVIEGLFGRLTEAVRQLPEDRERLLQEWMADMVSELRDAIVASGLSHYAIAQQAEIAPDILDRFVRGERDMRLATAAKVATVLGLELRSAKRVRRQASE